MVIVLNHGTLWLLSILPASLAEVHWHNTVYDSIYIHYSVNVR